MTVINLRPIGWNGMTPEQWRVVRKMIRVVSDIALSGTTNTPLWARAEQFLAKTEGRDV